MDKTWKDLLESQLGAQLNLILRQTTDSAPG